MVHGYGGAKGANTETTDETADGELDPGLEGGDLDEDTDHEKGRESSALVRSIDTSALPRTVHAVALSSSISGREVFKRCLGVSLDGLATLLPVGRANFAVLLL